LLHEVGDVASAARSVLRLADDPEALCAMGHAAREAAVRSFAEDGIVSRYEELYRAAVEGS